MNIQIFGKNKCFDTKKAQRYFRERGIQVQMVDLPRYGISRKELESVRRAVGGTEQLIDTKAEGAALLPHLAYEEDRVEKLLEEPRLLRTPIVRSGQKATVGYCPDIWKTWA
ncbi:MAG: arsenate reductase family protein [Oscillospiraceae bacterium]|jgi:arsenate reductase